MKFICPHCQQSLSAAEEFHGVDMDCPTCGESLKVPLPELPEIELKSPEDGDISEEIGSWIQYRLKAVQDTIAKWWRHSSVKVLAGAGALWLVLILIAFPESESVSGESASRSKIERPKEEKQFTLREQPPQYQRCYPCGGSGVEGGRQRSASPGSFAAHVNQVTGCRCGGQGVIQTRSGHVVTCPTCGGTGKRPQRRCPNCDGQGRVRTHY